MAERGAPAAGTVALLFTDIVGSTTLARALGSGWAGVLGRHHQILAAAIGEQGGWVEAVEGDGLFATFAGAVPAARAAVEAQRALRSEPWPTEVGQVRVRMGLHVGWVERTATGYAGLEVHRGARVAAAAHGGQLLLTAPARQLVGAELVVDDLGLHRLKDFPAPEQLFCAVIDGQGASSFPPPTTLALRSTNLPPDVTELVGRSVEVEEVARILTEGDRRLVTLTGRGGCGKTSLARVVGAQLLDVFPGGVWWVPLATLTDPSEVLGQVASAVQTDVAGRRSVLDALVARFTGPPALLVVDNLEHLQPAAHELGQLLGRVAGLRVLATSQVPLGLPVERVYRLQTLTESAAVELLVARGRLVDPGLLPTREDQVALAAVSRRVDSLPLALELVAARLSVLSPTQLEARLADSFDLVAGRSPDELDRHRSLRATFEWTLALLEPAAVELFTSMGVFARAASLEAIEAVTGRGTQSETVDALSSLVEFSLARRVEEGDGVVRFELPEALRQLAVVELEASPSVDRYRLAHLERVRETLWTARAMGFCTLAEAREARRLGPDARSAWQWVRGRDAAAAADLGALTALVLVTAGHVSEAEPFIAHSLACQGVGEQVLGWARYAQARAALMHGELAEALSLDDQAVQLLEHADPIMFPCALSQRGKARGFLGDTAGAIEDSVRATELSRSMGDIAWANGLLDEVQVWAQAGQGEHASRLVEQAAELLRSAPPSWAANFIENERGDAATAIGDNRKALGHYLASITTAAVERDDSQMFYDLCCISASLAREHRPAEALEILGMAEAQALDWFGAASFLQLVPPDLIDLMTTEVGPRRAEQLRASGRTTPPAERVSTATLLATSRISRVHGSVSDEAG